MRPMPFRGPARTLLAIAMVAGGAEPARAGVPSCSRLRVATTTSTDNSGLLKHLVPPFEAACSCCVDVIAVGTGKALKLGERGDVDVVLVHARSLEDRFIAEGWGVERKDVMYNDFVILGPTDDPARVRGTPDAKDAFRTIARSGAAFISRGDHSGTHEKEIEVWARAGITPGSPWYLEAGQGMSEVIAMAAERGAYVLSDHATYLAHRSRGALEILFEGDPALLNPYGVIAVNPRRHPNVNYALAVEFIAFLTGPEGRRLIAGFRVGGERLFFTGAP